MNAVARNVPLMRLMRLKSGDFITADEIEAEGAYPVYGGNGLRGYTDRWNTEGPIALVGRQGAHCGNVHVAADKCWVSEHAFRCFPEKSYSVAFIRFALETLSLNQYSVSAAQPGLSTDNLKSLPVPFPPLETQKRIAAFLDEKTTQIDTLIARKQALLARLAEKRQAIITQAVTKGLNPAAPLKDSGIDWLGQIPAHWEIMPLKRLVSIWGRIGFRGYTVNDFVSEGEGALSISPSNILGDRINYDAKTYISWDKYHESPEIKVRAEDILFVKTGSTIGKVCHVTNRPEPMTVNPQVVVLKVHSGHSLFLSAAMSSVYFQHQVKGCIFGGSTPAMTQYNLGSLAMVTPPLEEQQSISKCLMKADDEHSMAKSDVERSIELLTEYRAALITSAVTGKLEV